MRSAALAVVLCVAFVGCDKPKESAPAPSSSVAATPPAVSSPAPAPPPAPADTASAAASAAASTAPAPEKLDDVMVTVKDPTKEPERSVKVALNGKVTVFLPQYPGTNWTVEGDKSLGKPKEEVIPGFAGPTTPAHQFSWTTKSPPLKKGQKIKVQLVNKKDGKANGTFALNVELV